MDAGMDPVAYVPDPVDPTKMVNCVKEHGRFTVESISKQIKLQLSKYDTYDQQNDREARQFLLDILDSNLAREVRDVSEPGKAFPITFLRLIKTIRSTSIDRFEQLKNRIKQRKPHQYSGQDLSKMASDLRAEARELEIAGQYDHNLTLHMLDAFLEGGGNNNEDFRFPLRGLKDKLSKALLEIGYMAPPVATKHMADHGLTYKDICNAAVDQYRTQLDNSKWPPARGPTDSRAPPKAFANAAVCSTDPSITAHAFALIQKQFGSSGSASSDDECLYCKKKGHWARDCPAKKAKEGNPPKNGNNRRGQGRRDNKDRPRNPARASGNPSWKHTAPGPGAPTTKEQDGRTWRWCSKCARWSTTHGTDQHKGPSKNNNHANLAAFASYSAWNVPFICNPSFWDYLYIGTDLVGLLLYLMFGHKFQLFLSASLGYWLATLPAGIWSFAFELFSTHWHHLLIPGGWLLALSISIFGPTVLPFFFPPPPDPSWMCIKGSSARMKTFSRQRRHFIRPRSKSRSRRQHHHSLRNKATERPPLKYRMRALVWQALDSLQTYANSIAFRRVRQEGERRRFHRKKLKAPRSKPHAAWRNVTGLSTSQVSLMASPAAHALVTAPLDSDQAIRAAMLSMPDTTAVLGKQSSFPVVWDSGASRSVSPHRSDFVGPLEPTPLSMKLQGIARGIRIKGVGHVAWSFVDDTGMLRTLKVPALYVPEASTRLLSTNELMEVYKPETIKHDLDRLYFNGNQSAGVNGIEILRDPTTNLHVGMAYDHSAPGKVHAAFNSAISVTSAHNINLSPAEKELVLWHNRLGHLGYRKIQFLLQTGVLSHSESARRKQSSAARIQTYPMCAACQYGKQRRASAPGKRTRVVKDRRDVLREGDLFPGQKVSVDHFICSTRGRLLHTYGKEDPKQQYAGGAMFVDHATGYLFVSPQVHMTTHETLESKEKFEKHCRDFGVIPTQYHSDNGSAFTSQAYREHLETFAQISTYAGVGAHHHNGIAERAIQTVMSIARTMMLHSAIHWPDVADAALWPLAVEHAIQLYNHMPNPSTGHSPHDLFSKTRWPQSRFQHFQVWGCPAYVVDKSIQDMKSVPRWKTRSDRLMYVGHSVKHATSVARVLNLDTGAITTQFGAIADNNFATIGISADHLPDLGSPEWMNLFGESEFQYVLDSLAQAERDAVDLESDDITPPPRRQEVEAAMDRHSPPVPLPVPPPVPVLPSAPAPPPPSSPRDAGGLLLDPVAPASPHTPSVPPLTAPPAASSPPQPSHQRENQGAGAATASTEQPAQQSEPLIQQREPTVAPAPSTEQPRRSPRLASPSLPPLNISAAPLEPVPRPNALATMELKVQDTCPFLWLSSPPSMPMILSSLPSRPAP
jgi:hypothetical protein